MKGLSYHERMLLHHRYERHQMEQYASQQHLKDLQYQQEQQALYQKLLWHQQQVQEQEQLAQECHFQPVNQQYGPIQGQSQERYKRKVDREVGMPRSNKKQYVSTIYRLYTLPITNAIHLSPPPSAKTHKHLYTFL